MSALASVTMMVQVSMGSPGWPGRGSQRSQRPAKANSSPPVLEGCAVGGFFGDGFGAGVDGAVVGLGFFGPAGEQSPFERDEFAQAVGGSADGDDLLGGSDVVAEDGFGDVSQAPVDFEIFGDVFEGAFEGVAAAHGVCLLELGGRWLTFGSGVGSILATHSCSMVAELWARVDYGCRSRPHKKDWRMAEPQSLRRRIRRYIRRNQRDLLFPFLIGTTFVAVLIAGIVLFGLKE